MEQMAQNESSAISATASAPSLPAAQIERRALTLEDDGALVFDLITAQGLALQFIDGEAKPGKTSSEIIKTLRYAIEAQLPGITEIEDLARRIFDAPTAEGKIIHATALVGAIEVLLPPRIEMSNDCAA